MTVLDLDPIDVIFSVGERDYLNFMEARKAGTAEEFTPQIRSPTTSSMSSRERST